MRSIIEASDLPQCSSQFHTSCFQWPQSLCKNRHMKVHSPLVRLQKMIRRIPPQILLQQIHTRLH